MVRSASGQEKAEAQGIYFHVPFCASACDFCAFYQVTPGPGSFDRYLDDMERELALAGLDRPLQTAFWGGGTPGLLPPAALLRLGKLLAEAPGGAPAEWTIELAPRSVTPARLEVLRELGVSRISMGVQSFQPALLESLGRAHERDEIYRAYEAIRRAGFPSVNLDLIFAIPGQDRAAWEADLREALALQPDHLSTYCLTFEEDTALYVRLSQGRVSIDRNQEAELYESGWDLLQENGFDQYEISNFARPGHVCQHNLNTWRMHSWIGLGPSAASQHAGWRGTNPPDLDLWSDEIRQGRRASLDRVALSDQLLAEDTLVFGLRMNAGVDLDEAQSRFPEAPWAGLQPFWDGLAEEGLLERRGACIRLTRAGRLLCDAIGSELLNAMERLRPAELARAD